MLNHNIDDSSLASFYNVKSINPTTRADLNYQEDVEIDYDMDADKLSKDEQFALLDKLLQPEGEGIGQSYQKEIADYIDPLDLNGGNIIEKLVRRHVISGPDDPKVSAFLISSQNFKPKVYLEGLYEDASIESLMKSLRLLELNIQSQTKELKLAIDDNFVNVVNFKKSIDHILIEFKLQKTKAQQDLDESKVFNPQQHKFLNESDVNITSVLDESIHKINAASALSIRPIIENKKREQKLAKLVGFIRDNGFIFDLPKCMFEALKAQDHDKFIEYYQLFIKEKEKWVKQKEIDQDKLTANLADEGELVLERKISNTALSKVFKEVEDLVSDYKHQLYDEIMNLESDIDENSERFRGIKNAKFLDFVERLNQLKYDEKFPNPVNDVLSSQINGLRKDLEYQGLKLKKKFNMMQKRLFDYITFLSEGRENCSYVSYIGNKYSVVEDYFKASSSLALTSNERDKIILDTFESSENLDLSYINEAWLVVFTFINFLEELFCVDVSKFSTTYTLYITRKNIDVDADGKVWKLFFDLIKEFIDSLLGTFNNEKTSDKVDTTPMDYSTFVPYYSNSLSCIFYLSSISRKLNHVFNNIGKSVVSVGNLVNSPETNKIVKVLRNAISNINQKIVEAICATWINDCSQFYDLEKWEVHNPLVKTSSTHYTRAITILDAYERFVLMKLADIVFLRDTSLKKDYVKIVSTHPSKRMLVSIEIQLIRSLSILTDSIMKKYSIEKTKEKLIEEFQINSELYKVLTMNNLDTLAREIIPSLIRKYDSLFSNNLLEQNIKLYADIDKCGLTILDDILVKEKSWIEDTVNDAFIRDHRAEQHKKVSPRVDSFIFKCLIHFVNLIHVLKPSTGMDILSNIIGEMQLHFFKITLENLRLLGQNGRSNINLENLKLDVIFFVEVFEPSESLKLSEDSMKIVEVILDELHSFASSEFLPEKEFDEILIQSLKDSENEFKCFLS